MLPIHTILHATDFSDRSGYALRLACSLARDYGARLIVLHVVTPPTILYGEGVPLPDPDMLFREARDQLYAMEVPEAGVRAERWIEEGDPATEILAIAEEQSADLIVLGTHGRTGLRRLLLGSVAEQVMRKASCPVLTVSTPVATSPLPEVWAGERVGASEPG
jgi:nucleotide-binding universal stress UspA family protein